MLDEMTEKADMKVIRNLGYSKVLDSLCSLEIHRFVINPRTSIGAMLRRGVFYDRARRVERNPSSFLLFEKSQHLFFCKYS
jgi:hypothetical protein